MNKTFIIIWGILLACLLPGTPVLADDEAPKKWMVGTELDLVPYIYDGFYVSAVAGYGRWRVRFVRTNITTPGFATQSGFEDNELKVKACIIDYYFRDGFKGWWIGPGYETWSGEVKETNSGLRKKYNTDILTLGGGYTFRFNDHLYLNPWAAVHAPIGGDRDVLFVNSVFKIRTTSEASIKVGVNF